MLDIIMFLLKCFWIGAGLFFVIFTILWTLGKVKVKFKGE